MKITFLGAARTTTGSMHLIEACGKRILLDCGLYQGHRKESFEKNRNIPVDAKKIDFVILSHAHIDHSGNLPQLVRHGFRGRVFARSQTVDLCDVLLRDSCFLQKRDIEYVNKKRRAQGKNLFEELYDERDVDLLMQLMTPVHLHIPTVIAPGITLTFFNAGHILGSALTQLDIAGGNGRNHRILFSGDLGQPNQPILRHYEYPEGADIVLIESTYADRIHPTAGSVQDKLEMLVKNIHRHNSKLLVPAFSVGRTQQIIYFLNRLAMEGKLPKIPIYVDSPLSQKATKIYGNHVGCYNEEALEMIKKGHSPLHVEGLHFISTPEESMSLNDKQGPMIIIAASGMCEGGRVVHHLKQIVSDPWNIILIVGFQAENTLGRRLVEERNPIRILGEELELNARVETINALSAHADRNGLMDWYKKVGKNVKHAFAIHGEPEKVEAMRELLLEYGAPEASAPLPGQVFEFE
ncbi:MAG: MBL fold metallo-hydrolase [Kiritimatiellae bacterium]|nr:MBL fold metallo-hydrolase [Kiritimatiellia bacterium]